MAETKTIMLGTPTTLGPVAKRLVPGLIEYVLERLVNLTLRHGYAEKRQDFERRALALAVQAIVEHVLSTHDDASLVEALADWDEPERDHSAWIELDHDVWDEIEAQLFEDEW